MTADVTITDLSKIIPYGANVHDLPIEEQKKLESFLLSNTYIPDQDGMKVWHVRPHDNPGLFDSTNDEFFYDYDETSRRHKPFVKAILADGSECSVHVLNIRSRFIQVTKAHLLYKFSDAYRKIIRDDEREVAAYNERIRKAIAKAKEMRS